MVSNQPGDVLLLIRRQVDAGQYFPVAAGYQIPPGILRIFLKNPPDIIHIDAEQNKRLLLLSKSAGRRHIPGPHIIDRLIFSYIFRPEVLRQRPVHQLQAAVFAEFPIPVRFLKREILLYGAVTHIGIFIFIHIKDNPRNNGLQVIAVYRFLHLMFIIQPLLHLFKITHMRLVTEHFIQLLAVEGYKNLIHLIRKAVKFIIDFLHLLGIILLQQAADKVMAVIINRKRRPQHCHQQNQAEGQDQSRPHPQLFKFPFHPRPLSLWQCALYILPGSPR